MRLRYAPPPRPQIPTVPLAAIALLSLALVMISGLYAAPRGPAMRFATIELDGAFDASTAVRVEVLSEQEATIDGRSVTLGELPDALGPLLSGRSDPAVVLAVSPEATYEAMVGAYGAISGLPQRPRVALQRPSRGVLL